VENYFNYFTEIEECYQRCRETRTLLSPLDWALIESWKEAGLPLEAVLVGIERSFQKYQARARKYRKVNSLAYCSQEVLRAAEESSAARAEGGPTAGTERAVEPPFSKDEVLAYLERNIEALEQAARLAGEKDQPVLAHDLSAAARSLREIAGRQSAAAAPDLEELERTATALEEKLTASLTRAATVEQLAEFRREVEKGLVPYRRKMSAAQVESLERQFLKKRLFEHHRVPRLSLFYL
jgi:hypothetical protein